LAVGGLFGLGSHEYKGEDWFTGAYGYVVINNGVGQCYCDPQDYQDLIVHELSHSLGLGHIGSSSGMANMNPFCCNSIQTLDLQCMDFSYESGTILPVSLTAFEGLATPIGNVLSWTTSSEQNVESFVLERSTSPSLKLFNEVGIIPAVGNSDVENSYKHPDYDPDNISYYRLRVKDQDGSLSYGEIISISRPRSEEIKIFPTYVDSEFFIRLQQPFDDPFASMRIVDVSGKVLYSQNLTGELNQIKAHALVPGIYTVSVLLSGGTKIFRIQKR